MAVARARSVAVGVSTTAAALSVASLTAATPNTTFGAGPRDEALIRSAVAEGDPTDAATENPAFAAAIGTHIRVGYAGAGLFLRVNDRDVGAAPVSGFNLGTHTGRRLTPNLWAGLGLAIHSPDTQLASISFRPATEPQFVLYEPSLQRLTFDLVGAVRYGPVSVGGGASVALAVGGPGVGIDVDEDARGAHAAGRADISLGYKLAPLAGAVVHLGRAQLGASFRGELAVDLGFESVVRVALEGNPLNGTTTVIVRGASGYTPALVNLGARVLVVRGLSAFLAVEYAAYSAAPAPVADVTLDVRLGTTPALREGRFEEPRFRDTLSPKIGVEWRAPAPPLPTSFFAEPPRPRPGSPAAPEPWRVALRAGYAYVPSPVPAQTGFTSYADSARHGIGIGGAYHFGQVLGVDLAVSLAAQLHVLEGRRETKASAALPFPEYEVSGEIARGSLAIEGAIK
jgi:hypothetical protein